MALYWPQISKVMGLAAHHAGSALKGPDSHRKSRSALAKTQPLPYVRADSCTPAFAAQKALALALAAP